MGRPQDLKSGNMEERTKQLILHVLTDQFWKAVSRFFLPFSTQCTREAEKTRENNRKMVPLVFGPETVCALSSRPATEP